MLKTEKVSHQSKSSTKLTAATDDSRLDVFFPLAVV